MQNNRPFNVLEDVAKDYIPDNTNLVPRLAARLNKRKSLVNQIRTRPLLGALIVLLILLALSGAAYALGRAFGYVPGVGLVENSAGLRILPEPVSITREGVTLTVTQALVYPEHIQLVYEVNGIAPENDGTKATDAHKNPTAFCGGVNVGDILTTNDGDAKLRLPDGTVIERTMTGEYSPNISAMKPRFNTSLPEDARTVTMILKCVPNTRLGAVPEDWEVPLTLKEAPAGTVLGEPVIDVVPPVTVNTEPPSQPRVTQLASPSPVALPTKVPGATATLEKAVKLGDSYVFYIRMIPAEQRENFLNIMPVDVYVIDSSGQKIAPRLNPPYSPYTNEESLWEYQTMVPTASGPLKVVVDKAKIYYTSMRRDVSPTQKMIEDESFTFDAGPHPQLGQTWTLNKGFEISGYKLKVISARAVSWDENKPPFVTSVADMQGFESGYEFTMQSSYPNLELEASLSMTLRWSPDVQTPNCGLGDFAMQKAATFTYTSFCKGDLPNKSVRVTFQDISVLLDDTWEINWTPTE